MEQQGGTEEYNRFKVGEALAILSIHDDEFLSGIRNDLESTLWQYGFALSPWEVRDAREFLADNEGLTNEEIKEILDSVERRW